MPGSLTAGTITIDTLSDGTNSTSATNPILGSAKAWLRCNAYSPPTILESYNISSVTRSAAGDFTVNFTNAMSSSAYPILASLDVFSSSNGTLEPKTQNRTTSSFNIILQSTQTSSSPSYFDGSQMNIAVFNT